MKILVVEDESIISYDIQNTLEYLGYEVTDTVENYEDTIKSVQENEPQLILMDIHLENSKDGIETALAVHALKKIPIMYLTAFCDDDTINRAIQTNPLAYMIKPFNRDELKSMLRLAEYKLHTKMTRNHTEHIYLSSNYNYDFTNENLYYDNIPIKLTKKEKMLLSLLIEAKNTTVSFSDIEYNIWPDKIVANSTLRSLIFRLRSKLNHEIIETISNIGCRINIKT